MNQTTNAGIDLDKLAQEAGFVLNPVDQLVVPAPNCDARPHLQKLIELLARRAEPSVAADERALRLIKELGRISMSLAADLVNGADYTFQGHDYLDRNAVVDRVMQWRAEWDATEPLHAELLAEARAALASPAVSQELNCDGPTFQLTGWAGGAAPGGAFSTVTCEYRKPDGTVEVINYVRAPAVSQKDGAAVDRSMIVRLGAQAGFNPATCTGELFKFAEAIRAALARAPLSAQEAKKCQYPNCGCTSRTTCNFNYDADPAQAGDARYAVKTVQPYCMGMDCVCGGSCPVAMSASQDQGDAA